MWTTETVGADLEDPVMNLDREQTLELIALLEESLGNSDDERTKLEKALPLRLRSQLTKVERLLANANKRTKNTPTQRAAFWNAQEHLSNLSGLFDDELTEEQRTRIHEACLADFPGYEPYCQSHFC